MEANCLYRFRKTVNVSNINENGGGYVHQSNYLVQECHLHLSVSMLRNAATTTDHLFILLARISEKKLMIRDGTMWYQTDGCVNKYRHSVAYYHMSFLSKSYQIVLDIAVDTPDHAKYVMDDYISVQKQYLSTCLRMRSTPEVDKIDSKRMRVDAMTEKGELSFAE